MYLSIDQLARKTEGIETIVQRCVEEKWIRLVEKAGVQYVSKTDVYKLGFIFHLLKTGVVWEDIPRHLTPGNLYSVEVPGER
jgi:hypothetical protein